MKIKLIQFKVATFLFVFSAFILLSSQVSFGFNIENLDEIQKALNVSSWKARPLKQRIKVAILDKAFYGYAAEVGKSLPADTQYIPGPLEPPADFKGQHGLVMAQLLTAIMENPELHLYNAYGYSNFKSAIEDLINKKIDLVLYSEVWEIGGNRDGNGFINALVNQALDRGIVWVNAAGNFGNTSYTSTIQTLEEDFVDLPDQNHGLKIQCQSNAKNSKCPVKIVLSWNDFKDDSTLGTNKDLDLALVDDFMNVIATSGLKQTDDPKENRPGYSLYPRETISTEIAPGTYFLRVKNRSHNFNADKDELFISVDGDGLSMPSHSVGDSVLNPADNPRVITVGALDSDRSSYSVSLAKPNLLAMSSVKTDTEGEFRGSSNAAAFVAGALGLAKSRMPSASFSTLLQNSTLAGWHQRLRGLPLQWLGFSAANGRCFSVNSNISQFPQQLIDAVNVGGLIVQTTAGLRIMTPFDPIVLGKGLYRYQQNDIILTTPEGYKISPRSNYQIPYGWVEVFQTPMELGLCEPAPQPQGNIFRLYHLY